MAASIGFRYDSFGGRFRKVALCLPLAAALVGCQAGGGDVEYAKNGIGTDLYSADVAVATANLETYLGFICKQASVPTVSGSGGYPECAYDSLGPDDWTLIVQTGFNDIDRRCDGYLQWLENVRLRGSFVNSQINSTRGFTNAVLTSLYPAAGVTIGIVGQAFGFAQSSFDNYQSRLLLGFEGSTIKTIVRERSLDYRVEFTKVRFEFKPDVVNTLRSYLRICMPYTITMDANTFARTISAGMGLPRSFSAAVQREAVVGEQALSPDTAGSVATGNNPNNGIAVAPTGEGNENVIALFGPKSGRTVDSVKFAQQRLCVEADGVAGEKTRLSVTNRRRSINLGVVDGDDRLLLNKIEATEILQMATCDARKFTNFYETTILADSAQVDDFVDTYNKVAPNALTLGGSPAITSNAADDFRMKIAQMRAFLTNQGKLSETVPSGAESDVTFKLHDAMNKAAVN